VEADYTVWKEYAYNRGVHPAITTYLDVKKDHFYKIETTVDGKSFVTARSWSDLSDMIKLYEKNNIIVDEKLIAQYLQNHKIAKDFAVYYDLFNKYKSDYQVDTILAGKVGEDIKDRAKKAGAFNIETRVIDNLKVIKRLKDTADRVLLDVPCSGLGVLKRNFDSKWIDSTQSIMELIEIQESILENYSQMLKVDGYLVYSTCSILPSENQKQIEKFLAKNPNFILEEDRQIMPSEGGDGFYMARLKRIS
jgi:16S rRNA (cytosine967-C5)-methyltransferase